jgi:hypothetical protein
MMLPSIAAEPKMARVPRTQRRHLKARCVKWRWKPTVMASAVDA